MEKANIIYTGYLAKQTLDNILNNHDNINHYNKNTGALGYFLEDGIWIAFDNTTNNCWVEEFKTKKQAIEWVNKYH